MKIFQSATEKHQANVAEEILYGKAATELLNGNVSTGIYAKALAQAEGDERKVGAKYIMLRSEALRIEADAHIEQQLLSERRRQQEGLAQQQATFAREKAEQLHRMATKQQATFAQEKAEQLHRMQNKWKRRSDFISGCGAFSLLLSAVSWFGTSFNFGPSWLLDVSPLGAFVFGTFLLILSFISRL